MTGDWTEGAGVGGTGGVGGGCGRRVLASIVRSLRKKRVMVERETVGTGWRLAQVSV